MVGILAEKDSALKSMSAALGGVSGTYNGEHYVIVAASGHLFEFEDPEKQVDPSVAKKYASWDVENLPWDETQFAWKYKLKQGRKDILDKIEKVLSKCDEICIGTDVDPTGEGELLAWEILDHLKLRPKKWTRMYFEDESKKKLQEAFEKRKQLQSMQSDADYIMAYFRTRWDFLSMQYTRAATKLGDGRSVLREGRLKSSMDKLVGDALLALKAYKKVPYYQNRFRDENGVLYTNPEEKMYPDKKDVPDTYHASDVICDAKGIKHTAPPRMLDLAAIAARLAPRGYRAKSVQDTYQKMYEAQVVSYPRTADHVISPEQFAELLPLADKIAAVVGVDTKCLTHRQPRSTHVAAGGSHGANRPGPSVPQSLDSLAMYDANGSCAGCAAAIYELVAKNYLATLAEDYEYEAQKGHVKDYPEFTGTAAVPKKMGWKLVFNPNAGLDDDDVSDGENTKGLGTYAEPFVYEGFPPKPPTPTTNWLIGETGQLAKLNIGTGATRVSTYADVTSEQVKFPLMKETKGKLSLTDYGWMSYWMLQDTNIGSLDMTKKLFDEMQEVRDGKKDPEVCLANVQDMLRRDIGVMRKNGEKMRAEMGVSQSEKCTGMWNGREVSFKRDWSGHRFTDDECEALLDGQEIQFEAVSKKTGKSFNVEGKLAILEYKGKKYVGFDGAIVKDEQADDGTRYRGQWNGREVNFKREWSGHRFTDEECEALCRGEMISFSAVSAKKGTSFEAKGKLAEQTFKGNKYVGFQADFGDGGDKSGNTKGSEKKSSTKNAPVAPDTWCQHKFTDEEKQMLEAGLTVKADDFVSKKGSKFSATVRIGKTERGFGIICDFD